ncbi:hypothetical protein V6N13_108246 [Hibiscus sabdariffa]
MESRILRVRSMASMSYATSSEYCTLVFHHGGYVVNHLKLEYTGKKVDFFDMCYIDSISILELDDMLKELGYTTLHNMYWKQPGGMLRITPLKPEIDVLSMLGCLPRNKYVHVYIEENVRQNDAIENNLETAWIDEDEIIWGGECVRNDGSASDDEELEYIAFDNQDSDSDSSLEDSENDLADGDDEVCHVHVVVVRDIPRFSAGTRNDNEENGSETKSKGSNSLHSSVIKAVVRQYEVLNRYNVKMKVNDFKRLQDGFEAGVDPSLALMVVFSKVITKVICWQQFPWLMLLLRVKIVHLGGLIEEIGDLFLNAEHRTCVRHLYTNFKSNSGFQGKA